MALLLLRLPFPLQTHLSPSIPKPSPIYVFSPAPFPFFASTDNKGRGVLFHREFSSFPTNSSSSTTGATVEEVEGSVESSGEPKTRLIAQNIPWTCTAEDIGTLFEKYGTVTDVELSMHNSTRNRGLAFVTMAAEEEAFSALNNLNSYDLDGRVIKVELARSLKKNPSPSMADPLTKYTVFVGNLTWRVRSHDLRELFKGCGNVLSTKVIYQSSPRRSAGYGFVSFDSKEEAEAAIAHFNGKKLMGRSIRLVLGKSQTKDAEVKS